MKRIVLITLLALCALLLSAEETKQELLFPDHHLCLEASGRLVLEADQAVFSFDVTAYGNTLRLAVSKAKDGVAEICRALTALGIDPKSYSTAGFNTGNSSRSSFFLTDKKDYCATLNTSVTLKDLSKLDDAILLLTDKNVKNLSGVSFSLADQSAAMQRAREIALNRIVEQRDTICRILGVKVTDVQLIDEAPFEPLPWGNMPVYYDKRFSAVKNFVTVDGLNEVAVNPENSQSAFFAPEIVVETQVRVIYRIGTADKK